MNSGQFLKCDAPDCDHREDVDQLTADMVGKPCPVCGASLLTQEDFDKFGGLSAIMALFVGAVSSIPRPSPGTAATRIEVNLHDGELTLKAREVVA